MKKDFLYIAFKGLALSCLGLTMSLGLTACSDKEVKAPPKVVPVSAVKARSAKVPLSIEAVGNVRASASVTVRSQVGGSVMERLVEAGKDVRVGDVLYRIDPRPFDLAIMQAQANLEREQASLRKAEDDMKRYQNLIDRSAVSREQYDQARTSAEVLRGTVAMQKAMVEQAKLQREYTVITAPIAGRTGDILVDVGSIVKTADDNMALLTINTISPADVFFAVPENKIFEIMDRMKLGEAPVLAEPEGYNGPPIQGVLLSMNNSVDQVTGTITLKARFDNKEQKLWPGQFVRVHLLISEEDDAVLAPAKAVQEGAQGTYVYVINPADNTVEVRPVKIQDLPGDEVLVLSGLAAGETVVTEGQLNLRPGSRIQIKGGQSEAGAPAPVAPGSEASAPAVSGDKSPGAKSPESKAPGSESPGTAAPGEKAKTSAVTGMPGAIDLADASDISDSADIFSLGIAVAGMSSSAGMSSRSSSSSSRSSSYSAGGISGSAGGSSMGSSRGGSFSKSGSSNNFAVGSTTSTTTTTGGGGRSTVTGNTWMLGGGMQMGGSGVQGNGIGGPGGPGGMSGTGVDRTGGGVGESPSPYMNTPNSPYVSPTDSLFGSQSDFPRGNTKP